MWDVGMCIVDRSNVKNVGRRMGVDVKDSGGVVTLDLFRSLEIPSSSEASGISPPLSSHTLSTSRAQAQTHPKLPKSHYLF